MITRLITKCCNTIARLKDDQRGVTAIEYGLIAVAMAVLLAGALGTDGFIGNLTTAFTNVSDTVASLSAGGAEATTPPADTTPPVE